MEGGTGIGRAVARAGLLATLALAGSGSWLESAGAAHAPDAGSVRLGLPGAVNSGPSVAVDGSSVVVTWAARTENATDVYAAFSGDGGASFGAATRVNDVPGEARVSGEQAPRVAFGRGVQVVWGSKRNGAAQIRTATARPEEQKFAPAAAVHADNLRGGRGWASLAVDRDGAAHVVWLDGRGDTPAGTAPGAEAATSGHKAMRQDIFQAVLRPDGTHDEARLATDVCFCCKTAVATGADGSVYVAWRHIYPPNLRDMAMARSTDGGRTFGPPVRVSEDGWAIDACPDDGPSLAVDAGGVVHVAWPTMVGEAKGIFYTWSADGGRTFAARMRVDDGGGAAHPQIALAGDAVVIVWDQVAGGQRRACLREINAGAKAAAAAPGMGPVSVLSADRSATYPVVAAAGTDLVVAWTEEAPTGFDIRVRRVRR